MVENDEIVVPGDRVGTIEEVIPGRGTYEEDGVVYSTELGKYSYDLDEMKALVYSKKQPAIVKKRDIIIARVRDIRNSMVVADVVKIVGQDREVAGETMASLHVSKISRDYVSDVRREYRIGDFIRAIVIQAKPSIQLATDAREFGVLRALCMACRTPMKVHQKQVKCPECERIESRKLAEDFGNPNLKNL
jgi:exosome complex component CSL4